MGAGNCVVAYDTPENREVVGDAALLYDSTERLTQQLQISLEDAALTARLRGAARSRARALYSWDAIADQYEKLLLDMVTSK